MKNDRITIHKRAERKFDIPPAHGGEGWYLVFNVDALGRVTERRMAYLRTEHGGYISLAGYSHYAKLPNVILK